ncbi:MAG: molybdopterin-dependent oxidoreductase [Spirochaetes bacterium]|jgi:formate dehydrogenase major subunit|nr:molybdopterin-dependent oxidoreductase [Spirochaetota bacterium]
MNYKAGVCNFCGTGCGHILNVEGGAVNGVFALQGHPVSKGRLCVRGWHMHELLRDSQRIDSPMIKKNGRFEKAGYDEAISLVAKKLGEYKNPSSEIAFLASPRSSNEDGYLLMKLARSVFKTNNISLDSESGHRNSLNVLHRGTGMAGMLGSLEDIKKAEYILVIGTDLTRQNPIIGSEIHMAARAGSKVVTVGSKLTQIAKLSDVHLQLKPGSKKVFLAAVAKSLIEENLHDAEFIQKHTEGFDGFANSLGSLSHNDISSITGLGLEDIKTVARDLATAKTAMVFFTSGISGLDEDTVSYIYNLFVIAGKIGKEGCGVNPVTGICNLQGGYDMGLAPDLLTGFRPISDKSAAKSFSDAWGAGFPDEPGRGVYEMLADKSSGLKALVVVDHDESIVRQAEAIKKLDFVVYVGSFENPFAEYADVVIPSAAYVEYDGTYTSTDRRVQLSRKKTEPAEGVMPAWRIFTGIAEKASARWSYSSPADVMAEIAKLTPSYSGISYDRFSGVGGIQWPCDGRRPEGTRYFRVDDAASKIKLAGVTGSFKTMRPSGEYPWLLMVGKANHFWHQNNLMKRTFIPKREYNATLLLYPKGYVEISGDDAKKLQVRDRWPVNIVSQYGSMKVAVRVSDEVRSETAFVPYFIQDMITEFLLAHNELIIEQGEDAIIPIRIEKV